MTKCIDCSSLSAKYRDGALWPNIGMSQTCAGEKVGKVETLRELKIEIEYMPKKRGKAKLLRFVDRGLDLLMSYRFCALCLP